MESRKTAAGRSAQDAIAMLKADHERVRQLGEQFERAAGARTPDEDRKQRLAERLCQEIDVHAQLEEELFYPAVRASIADEDLMDEAQVEHQSAKDLVRQIRGMSPSDDLYDARVKVLGEYVRHHVQEEESQMFRKAKRAKVDMADLGRRMAERRRQLESEHAMAPFETIASMLMMPIRAAASAARAGAAAGRRAAAGGTRATGGRSAGTRSGAALEGAATRASGTKRAATGTRAAGTRTTAARAGTAARVTATRATGAVTRAAAAGTRAATGTGRGGATGAARGGATSGARAGAAGAAGRARAGAASAGGRAAASAGQKRGAAKGGKATTGARRSRTTR